MKDDDDLIKQFNNSRKDDEKNKYSDALKGKIEERAREYLKALAKNIADQQKRKAQEERIEINRLLLQQENLNFDTPAKKYQKSKETIDKQAEHNVWLRHMEENKNIVREAERDIEFMVSQEIGGMQDSSENTPAPETKDIDLTAQKITIDFNNEARDPRGPHR
jgi:hypothetical protein